MTQQLQEENPDETTTTTAAVTRGNALARWGRALAVGFFSFVALAIGVALVPVESLLGGRLNAAFTSFHAITGLDQHWNMFGTISYHRDYDVSVEIESSGGGWKPVEGVGPILPGLAPLPGHFRYHTFFTRLDEKRYARGVEPYTEALGRAILAEHPDWKGRRFRVRKVAARLNSLDVIRELDQPSYEQSTIHGPYDLGSEHEGGRP